MEKIGQLRLVLFCAIVIAAGVVSYAWNGFMAFGEEVEALHKKAPIPTSVVIRLIGSHTSNIFNALLNGDFKAVEKEANALTESSKVLVDKFFPKGGEPGDWFKEMGKDPKDTEAVMAMRKDFEYYLKTVNSASKSIAATAKRQDLMETYRSLDTMLTKACFACHEALRPILPEEWLESY